MKSILTFVLVFGVIVIVHEFGHFFFAKRSGILVREFAIGMGPKIFSYRKNGTTYTIRILPLGGYVRMAGAGEEEEELSPGMPLTIELNENNEVQKINTSKKVILPNGIPLELFSADLEDELVIKGHINGNENELTEYKVNHDATIIEESGVEVQIAPRDVQFQSAKLWQRMLTNFAGPMNNFILGIVLFILLAFVQGGIPKNTDAPIIGEVIANSAAEKAGLKENDQILTVADQKVTTFTQFSKIIQEHPKQQISVVINRAGKEKTIAITPKSEESNGKKVGKIGVSNKAEIEKISFINKIKYGFTQAFTSSLLIFKALGNLVTGFSLNKLGGPVMIFQQSAQVSAMGGSAIISFMALLSMNLGIMNLLPIPVLDGGKLLLNVIEGIRRKPLSQEKEGVITLVGVVLMLVLMVLVTWNDIQRLFQ